MNQFTEMDSKPLLPAHGNYVTESRQRSQPALICYKTSVAYCTDACEDGSKLTVKFSAFDEEKKNSRKHKDKGQVSVHFICCFILINATFLFLKFKKSP